MVNYQQGKIYKIECNITGLIYIGSTCKTTLAQRMSQHRSKYKEYLNGKSNYYSSFTVMENNDYDIILIEDYPCNSKDQLFARERYYTNKIECVNIRKNQGRYLELGKKEYFKKYKKENTDTIQVQQSEYYKMNKQYLNDYSKEYYVVNIDEINTKKKEKFNCLCGGKYTRCSRSQHFKTKMHQKYLEEQKDEE